ncbi:MAG: DNA-binding protein, partial [Pseudomonadota bacterium]|nr:DNA-binding protein [Pseudomonadota bacterium]
MRRFRSNFALSSNQILLDSHATRAQIVYNYRNYDNYYQTSEADIMARKLISEADVHATADALVAEGKEPTILAIYSVLGCGSYSTISKYKKT